MYNVEWLIINKYFMVPDGRAMSLEVMYETIEMFSDASFIRWTITNYKANSEIFWHCFNGLFDLI